MALPLSTYDCRKSHHGIRRKDPWVEDTRLHPDRAVPPRHARLRDAFPTASRCVEHDQLRGVRHAGMVLIKGMIRLTNTTPASLLLRLRPIGLALRGSAFPSS